MIAVLVNLLLFGLCLLFRFRRRRRRWFWLGLLLTTTTSAVTTLTVTSLPATAAAVRVGILCKPTLDGNEDAGVFPINENPLAEAPPLIQAGRIDKVHRIVMCVRITIERLRVRCAHAATVGIRTGQAAGETFVFAPPGVI